MSTCYFCNRGGVMAPCQDQAEAEKCSRYQDDLVLVDLMLSGTAYVRVDVVGEGEATAAKFTRLDPKTVMIRDPSN